MTLSEFVGQGWAQHGNDAEGVFARLPEGVSLIAEAKELPQLAGLVVHVAGEHCGKWEDGVSLLRQLTEHAVFDGASPEGKTIWRSMAVLHHCAGDLAERDACMERGRSAEDAAVSDEIRLLAVSASALAGQHRTGEAIESFTRALDLASYGPGKDDPAARALAITGNNLAAELGGKSDRTDEESRLMLEAAQAGRRFWEIAGNWNVDFGDLNCIVQKRLHAFAGAARERYELEGRTRPFTKHEPDKVTGRADGGPGPN